MRKSHTVPHSGLAFVNFNKIEITLSSAIARGDNHFMRWAITRTWWPLDVVSHTSGHRRKCSLEFFLTKRERETLVSPVSAVLIGKNAQWTPNCQNTPNGMSDYDVWHFENENFCVYVRKWIAWVNPVDIGWVMGACVWPVLVCTHARTRRGATGLAVHNNTCSARSLWCVGIISIWMAIQSAYGQRRPNQNKKNTGTMLQQINWYIVQSVKNIIKTFAHVCYISHTTDGHGRIGTPRWGVFV